MQVDGLSLRKLLVCDLSGNHLDDVLPLAVGCPNLVALNIVGNPVCTKRSAWPVRCRAGTRAVPVVEHRPPHRVLLATALARAQPQLSVCDAQSAEAKLLAKLPHLQLLNGGHVKVADHRAAMAKHGTRYLALTRLCVALGRAPAHDSFVVLRTQGRRGSIRGALLRRRAAPAGPASRRITRVRTSTSVSFRVRSHVRIRRRRACSGWRRWAPAPVCATRVRRRRRGCGAGGGDRGRRW